MSKEYPCVYYDNEKCKKYDDPEYVDWCVLGPCPYETPSNADRIRAMSDEELMEFIFNEVSCGSICELCVPKPRKSTKCDGHCRNGILDWLKAPAKGDE